MTKTLSTTLKETEEDDVGMQLAIQKEQQIGLLNY
jgi:hypothetical protein